MPNVKMRAVRVHEYGGPQVLRLEEVQRPEPGAHKVLVRLEAAGVNPIDWKLRSGMLKDFMPVTFPWTPGIDGAGLVEELGPETAGLKQGERVFGVFGGSYAEFTVAAEGDIHVMPGKLSFAEAAAVPVGALTAWKAVIEDAGVRKGQHILVLGASGGVGLFAVQLARWKGARVTGTSSAANLDFLRSLGAEAFDYRTNPYEKQIHDVDIVMDTVGGETLDRAYQTLRPGGVIVSVGGQVSEEKARARGARAIRSGRAPAEKLHEIASLLESGSIRPVVGAVFPLAEVAQAHERVATRHGRGRIILQIEHVPR
jgi:NADPH:quinone reductase-like Zn-dependent oxidoreductase